MLQPRVPGNNSLSRTVRIVECSLSHRRAQGRVSSQPRTPTDFCENLTCRECTAQAHIPRFLKPSLESVKGRHNQVTAVASRLCTVAYTMKITKLIDCTGVIAFFLATGNLGMESGVCQSGRPVGCRYVIPMATRHTVQSSLKGQDRVSFFFKMQ